MTGLDESDEDLEHEGDVSPLVHKLHVLVNISSFIYLAAKLLCL